MVISFYPQILSEDFLFVKSLCKAKHLEIINTVRFSRDPFG